MNVDSKIYKFNKIWRDYSFFIEFKKSGDFASLFIDCPPRNDDILNLKNSFNEYIRIGTNSLEIVENVYNNKSFFVFNYQIL